MKANTILTAAAVTLAVAATAAAQSKSDFSGQWVAVSPDSAAGQELTVVQTATTVTTGHASEGGGHQFTYKLDGTESRNVITSHGEDIVSISKAYWDGDRIVITTATTYPDGRKLESKQVWSVDAEGRLIIDRTETMQGKPPATSKGILTKKR